MTEVESIRPLAAVLISLVAVAAILASHRYPDIREGWSVAAALGKFAIVASMIPGVLDGRVYVWELETFVPYVTLGLRADPLGMLFALLASLLWIFTTFYSIGYMRGLGEHSQTRYFAAFAASLSAAIGIAFASNLVTIFLFYEMLSIVTYPLVAHDETEEARIAGRKYLAYTFLGGGVLVLAGTVIVFWLTSLHADPTVAFSSGGIEVLMIAAGEDPWPARVAFFTLVMGFGVKAAIMPVQAWLPDAMVAPTPVSGLLHAVAVVKSGAFGVARIILDVFGVDLVADLGVGVVIAALAAFTIVAASLIALRKDNLKRRLAYSTVSQLSYIVLGVALLGPYAVLGGLFHMPAHAFMKLTLFFCAGTIHVETHIDDISKMGGIGKRMPLTMSAFAVAAAGMAGMPLLAGFVSKFYLVTGGIQAGEAIFAMALIVSGVLNVAYFWPVVYTAFFETRTAYDSKPLVEYPPGVGQRAVPDGGHDAQQADEWERHTPLTESTWFMLAPITLVVIGAVILGIIPGEVIFLELIEMIVDTSVGGGTP